MEADPSLLGWGRRSAPSLTASGGRAAIHLAMKFVALRGQAAEDLSCAHHYWSDLSCHDEVQKEWRINLVSSCSFHWVSMRKFYRSSSWSKCVARVQEARHARFLRLSEVVWSLINPSCAWLLYASIGVAQHAGVIASLGSTTTGCSRQDHCAY